MRKRRRSSYGAYLAHGLDMDELLQEARQRQAELERWICNCVEPHPIDEPCRGPQYETPAAVLADVGRALTEFVAYTDRQRRLSSMRSSYRRRSR